MMNKNVILVILLSFLFGIASGQSMAEGPEPEVGKPMPKFKIAGVRDYKKSDFSLEDARGKWTLMFFWYRGCANSIRRLPNYDSLYKKYNGKMEFILIGKNNKRSFGQGMEEAYQRLKVRQGFTIPHAFDSVLCRAWTLWTFPRIYIIDPNGMVRYITTGENLSSKSLDQLLKTGTADIYPYIADRPSFTPASIPDTSKLILRRSTLVQWAGEQQRVQDVKAYQSFGRAPGIEVSRLALTDLFTLAFTGKRYWFEDDTLHRTVYPVPVIEMRDASIFSHDYLSGKGVYNYQLVMHGANVDTREVMRTMQQDLQTIFHVDARFEDRMMPVWSLTTTPSAIEALKRNKISHAQSTNINGDGGAGGFSVAVANMRLLMELVTRYIDEFDKPYFDDTGVTFNFSITMDALMTDRGQVIKALQQNGMDLRLITRRMKVLVIRDRTD